MSPASPSEPSHGPCQISRECGGCALIDTPYAETLRLKTERVRAAIRRYSELADLDVAECVAAPSRLAYRNRAKLAVAWEDGEVRIGLYRRGTNRIVDLGSCVVTEPALLQAVQRIRAWLARHDLARPRGPVFYVDLRACAGERCHVTLVVSERDLPTSSLSLEALAQSWPELVGVAINEGDPSSSFPLGSHTRVVVGADTFDARIPGEDGIDFDLAVPVGGFFQVAASLLPDVHHAMREHVQGDRPLYDLYSGVGVHGLMVERPSTGPDAFVIGIEEVASAVLAAVSNARRVGVRASYHAGRVEDALPAALAATPARRFLHNPARAGSKPEVLDTLLGVGQARIAYLSCEPTTLARDLAHLARGGLRARTLKPFDLMPQTDHVETLALIA